MKYYLLGKSGLRVSELALGTMTFGTDWGWGSTQSSRIYNHYLLAEWCGLVVRQLSEPGFSR